MMSKKKTKTSIKYIPLELWTLILPRMPGKTLLRFKSICKSWCSIIDDPDFIHLHLQLCNTNNIPKNKLFVVYYDGKRSSIEIRRADNFKKTGHNITSFIKYICLGSCNGLLLMRGSVGTWRDLRLWNPSIRKSLLIPPCPMPTHLNCNAKFVFGFAPSTKEHKILALSYTHTKAMYFAVYKLNDQQWTVRNINLINVEGSCLESLFSSYFYDTVFFQGAVHSITRGIIKDRLLVSIDIDLEKFTFRELPYIDGESSTMRKLFILGESVAVLNISEVNASIWVLKLEGGKKVWTLWFSEPSTPTVFNVFQDHMDSKAYYYESDEGGCLIIGKNSYNLASGEVQKRGKSHKKYVELETYLENLMLYKGYKAKDDVFPME